MPLTYDRRIQFTYPSGLQTLHANFYSDDNGFYFASGGRVHAFDWDGSRNTSNDVVLTNAPNVTVWGFTEEVDGGWAILTRETGTGVIGMVRKYTHAGAEVLTFPVQSSIPTVTGETFRAPKSLVQHEGDYFVRVVRSVRGNMRFLRFDKNGAPRNADLTLAEANPSALSDMAESNGILFIAQQNTGNLYATDLDDSTHQLIPSLQTSLQSDNSAPFGLSGGHNNVYVADRGGYVYVYSGVPTASSGGGGANFVSSLVGLMARDAIMSRNMNRRNERR